MNAGVQHIAGQTCLIADATGPPIDTADAARDLIGEAMAQGASIIVVPVTRLDPSFFQLRSGLAGDVLQKVVNYGRKLAVVGDISAHVAASDAFRDVVREADRGESVYFAADLDALVARIERTA